MNRSGREVHWTRSDLATGITVPVYNNHDGVYDSDNYAIEQSDGGEESLQYFNLVVRIVTIVNKLD